SSLPLGTGWPDWIISVEPTMTLNGFLKSPIVSISVCLPVSVYVMSFDCTVVIAGTASIVPICFASGSFGSITDIGATYTFITGVATLSVFAGTEYVSESIVTWMIG